MAYSVAKAALRRGETAPKVGTPRLDLKTQILLGMTNKKAERLYAGCD